MLINGLEQVRIFDGVWHEQVNASPKQGLQVKKKTEISIGCMSRFKRLELNKKIEVAGLCVKHSRSRRPKKLKPQDTVFLAQSYECLTMLLYQLNHIAIIIHNCTVFVKAYKPNFKRQCGRGWRPEGWRRRKIQCWNRLAGRGQDG